jgi:predicted transcriptional regulator
VLLGRLRKAALDGDPDAVAEAVMEAGPSTVRPDTSLEELVGGMQKANLTTTLVSTPEGVFMGLLRREHAEAFLGVALPR